MVQPRPGGGADRPTDEKGRDLTRFPIGNNGVVTTESPCRCTPNCWAAAYGERPRLHRTGTRSRAVNALQRCRREILEYHPSDVGPDTVPVVLALQVAYDVALLDLASVVGVDAHPDSLRSTAARATAAGTGLPGPRDRAQPTRTPACRPGRADGATFRCPSASLRASWTERSLRRAANVAAWVRRSIPSLDSRFET